MRSTAYSDGANAASAAWPCARATGHSTIDSPRPASAASASRPGCESTRPRSRYARPAATGPVNSPAAITK